MRKFGRKKQYRMNMLRNLATSLVVYEKVETTLAKGKELSTYIDHLISRSKTADLNATRYLNSVLFSKIAAKKVIEELVPRYKDRNSGFSRVIKVKNRIGDNSTVVRVELIDQKVFVQKDDEKKTETKESSTKGGK